MQHHLLSNISYLLSIICGRGDRSGRSRDRSGFTLVEMLVVIVIIVILMGIVFRMSRGVMSTNLIAKEQATVQVWKSLIEEFYDEYGCYPPVPAYDAAGEYHGKVQPIEFQGPQPGNGTDLRVYMGDDPAGGQDIYIRHNGGVRPGKRKDVFVFGLASFFVNRANLAWCAFNQANHDDLGQGVHDKWERVNDPVMGQYPVTPDREVAFLKRTKPIRERIETGLSDAEAANNQSLVSADDNIVTNFVLHPTLLIPVRFSVRPWDAWHNDYVYISEPPYSSYIFFSQGPDGKYDTDYPADPNRPKNKDNIYGTLFDK